MKRAAERIGVFLGVVVVGLVALACKRGSSSEDSDASAAAASPSVAAPPEVQRYADEQAIDDATVITLKTAATARTSADTTSTVVGELAPGSKILPIAVRANYALVVLGTDPSSDPQGWVDGEAILTAIKANGKPSATAKPVAQAKPAAGGKLVAPPWLVLAPGENIASRDGKCYVVTRPVPVRDDTARCEPLPAPAGSDFIGLPDSLDRACPVGFTQAGAYSCTRSCKQDADCSGGKGCDSSDHLCKL